MVPVAFFQEFGEKPLSNSRLFADFEEKKQQKVEQSTTLKKNFPYICMYNFHFNNE